MARYIIQQRLQHPEQLQAFDLQGYYYSASHSSADKLVFLRDQAED